MVVEYGKPARKKLKQSMPENMARRSFHPVDVARDLAKAALPQAARNWLRSWLTSLQSRFPLIRRLLGPGSGAYRYVAPSRPESITPISLGDRDVRFSIVVPIRSGSSDAVQATIRSVEAQWYPFWELIVACDVNSSPEVRLALAHVTDTRIQILSEELSEGIWAAGNRAIAAAKGDYIVFIDQGDELTVECLYELALAIHDTGADFLYSDEDRLSPRGRYVEPFFKPDWSPDTLMSIMYARHVGCVRRSLLDITGGFRSGFDGGEDWDLALRITEEAQRIIHVPKVLYHSRGVAFSELADREATSVIAAGKRAREDALARRGVPGTLEAVPEAPDRFRARPHIQGAPLISIVIPSKNNGRVLGACLEAIQTRSSYRNIQIVVLDNGTTDAATLQMLERQRLQGVKIIRHDAPFNYSELNNIGARHADGELLLFLNDDTEVVTPDWLERMAGFAQLPHVGAVGAKLIYPQTGNIQHIGVVNAAVGPAHALLHERADAPGYFMRNLLDYNWLAVTGACLMVSRKKFDQIRGFREQLPVAYNDVDLCFRLYEAGYFNVVAAAVRLLHYESISRGDDLADPVKKQRLDADREKLYELHPRLRGRDPFYNPNLNPFGVHFEFRR